jgi:hypothetical protein
MSPMPNGTEAGAATSIAEGARVLLHDPAFRDLTDLHSNQVARNTTTPVHDKGMAAEFPPLPSANQLSHAVTGPLNLLTQVAAAQGTAGGHVQRGKCYFRKVTFPHTWTSTPAGTFTSADVKQLLGCLTSELRKSSLQRSTTGSP